MSNELYYRGSEEYAVAVKNQLQRMESQGIRDANKIAFSIQNMEYGIRSDIRQSTYAIVASQEMLRQTFQQGFDSVNNTLQLGFGMMSAKMDELKEAIYQVGDEICGKLDEIHDIMNNPLLTASRELYRRALKNYQNGYFTEALEDIKQAVEKNKTDYISWELMGEIYLYGAGKFSNVINLDEAEKAFENAAKYIDADLRESDEAKRLGMLIYYELGYTRFLKSNDLLVEGDETKSIEMLGKSTGDLGESLNYTSIKPEYILSPETFENYHSYFINYEILKESKISTLNEEISVFEKVDKTRRNDGEKADKEIGARKNEISKLKQQPKIKDYQIFHYCKILTNLAKDKHFQGKDDEALDLISKAIDADSNNALIFSTDKDFESLWGKIDNLIEEKRKFLISKIEEERNKVSKLEFTQEKINSFLSEFDSFSSGYKDAPFLSLAEMLKKAITLFGTNENEINEKKKFLQKLKDFIAQCSENENCTGYNSYTGNSKNMHIFDSELNFYIHNDEVFSNSYEANFYTHVEQGEPFCYDRIHCSYAIMKYIDKIAPKHDKIPFIDVLSKIKDDMEQNYVKVYSFAEQKEFLDVLNSIFDKKEAKAKAVFEAQRAAQRADEETGNKIAKGCGIGCLVFVIIYVLICVAMCAAGAD